MGTDNAAIMGFVQTTFFVPLFSPHSKLSEKDMERAVLKCLKEQVKHKRGTHEKTAKKSRT